VEPTPVSAMQAEPAKNLEPETDIHEDPVTDVEGDAPVNGILDDDAVVEVPKDTDVGDVVGDVTGDTVDMSDLAEFGDAQMELTDV
jgi:hypothetical protein